MIFKAFKDSADYVSMLTNKVNEFIEEKEALGCSVESKQVDIIPCNSNALISPTIIVSIWMEQYIPKLTDDMI